MKTIREFLLNDMAPLQAQHKFYVLCEVSGKLQELQDIVVVVRGFFFLTSLSTVEVEGEHGHEIRGMEECPHELYTTNIKMAYGPRATS